MKAVVYNQKAEKTGTIELPDSVFGLKWNPVLVWQVAESERARARQIVAHAKGRQEVRGGGRKPWRQKGTGRARHGSIRSPLWIGGGVTHGPTKDKSYTKKINKKMKKKALAVLISRKIRDGEVLVLDAIDFQTGKTKESYAVLQTLGNKIGLKNIGQGASALVALENGNKEKNIRSLRNIPKIDVREASAVNVSHLLASRFLLLPKEGLLTLQKRLQ